MASSVPSSGTEEEVATQFSTVLIIVQIRAPAGHPLRASTDYSLEANSHLSLLPNLSLWELQCFGAQIGQNSCLQRCLPPPLPPLLLAHFCFQESWVDARAPFASNTFLPSACGLSGAIREAGCFKSQTPQTTPSFYNFIHVKICSFAGLTLGQGMHPGCGFNPQSGCKWEVTNPCFSPLLPLPLSLKGIKKIMSLGED